MFSGHPQTFNILSPWTMTILKRPLHIFFIVWILYLNS